MKVRALSTGYLRGARIRPGTEFTLPKDLRIGKWMEPLDDEAKAAKKAEDKRRQRNADAEFVRMERLRKLAAGEPAGLSEANQTTLSRMTREQPLSIPSGGGHISVPGKTGGGGA